MTVSIVRNASSVV